MDPSHKQPAGLKDISNITSTNMKTTSSILDDQDKENADPRLAIAGGSKEQTKKIINHGRWTKEEDTKLKTLIQNHGERWSMIASHYSDRSDVQCHHRWSKTVNPEIVKGTWTKEEDEQLVKKYGSFS